MAVDGTLYGSIQELLWCGAPVQFQPPFKSARGSKRWAVFHYSEYICHSLNNDKGRDTPLVSLSPTMKVE